MNSPLRTWLAAWLVLLSLTLYSANEVYGMVVEASWLEERPEAQAMALEAADKLVALADTLGLSEANEAVSRAREELAGEPSEVDLAPIEGDMTDEPLAEGTESLPTLAPGPSGGADPARLPAKRVLLVGASSIQFALGTELERLLEARGNVTVRRLGKASTGLVRLDAFDWLRKVPALVEEFAPDVMIANYGGNDAQGMVVEGDKPAAGGRRDRQVFPFGTPEWDEVYAERVGLIVRAATSRGAHAVMIGMPIMRQPSFSKKIQHINELTERATTENGGLYLSSWELASDAQGNYLQTLEWNGKRGPMRMTDGHHFTTFGGQYVADFILADLEKRGMLAPAQAAP